MCLKALKWVENIPIRVKLSWPRDQDSGRNQKCKKVERFKHVQNFIFNIWGGGEGELARAILHTLMSWYKCSNGRITEWRLQNNVRSPSYDSYDSLVIFVPPSPLQSCLPASPAPAIQLQRGLAYFLAEYLEWYIVYRLSVSQPTFCRSLKTHALMTKDFYIWHEDSNNFHMPYSLSFFTYLRYVPNFIELCRGFHKMSHVAMVLVGHYRETS